MQSHFLTGNVVDFIYGFGFVFFPRPDPQGPVSRLPALTADLHGNLFHPGCHVREELFQERVVRQDGAHAGHDGSEAVPGLVDVPARRFAGDPAGRPCEAGGLSVQSHGVLQDDQRETGGMGAEYGDAPGFPRTPGALSALQEGGRRTSS